VSHRALGIAAALLFVFLWASAFVPSKIGVLDSSPLWFLVIRFIVSGAVALAAALALGARLPRGRGEWTTVIVLGDAPGNEILHEMAAVIAVGLVSSTLLLLFLVPAAYAHLQLGRAVRARMRSPASAVPKPLVASFARS